ncbi:MAG: DNA-processing protein DprA [Bacteroidales bacterium]|jgi:DNA processing protein|nr:DNA-processing protein DprA [Bacteroidales bacterium]
MSQHTSRYLLALNMLEGIGPIMAKQLVTYFGSAEAVFNESPQNLQKINGIGGVLTRAIRHNNALRKADEELELADKKNIKICAYTDAFYPERLRNCEDSPLIFFYSGNVDFNSQKIISIVGTRNATEYGRKVCEDIIAGLASYKPIIISGLAFGIDVCAHKNALQNGLETIAVLGSPMQRIHPSGHFAIAEQIREHGAVLSEYHSKTVFEKSLFVRRNRIIAGMSDASIIIESKKRGGALLTADFAQQYNRDVFAIPGSVGQSYSEGCNMLIKTNKAALIESANDVVKNLNWDIQPNQHVQKRMFVELTDDEQTIHTILTSETEMTVDVIALRSTFPMSKVSSLLLSLEFKGVVQTLPGKRYRLT